MADAKELTDEFTKNVKQLKGWDLYGAIGAALFAVAAFLPFVTLDIPGLGSSSASFEDKGSSGWIAILAVVAAGVAIVLKKPLFAVIGVALGALIYFPELFDVMGEEYVETGIGAWLMLVGIAAAGYTAVTSYLEERKG